MPASCLFPWCWYSVISTYPSLKSCLTLYCRGTGCRDELWSDHWRGFLVENDSGWRAGPRYRLRDGPADQGDLSPHSQHLRHRQGRRPDGPGYLLVGRVQVCPVVDQQLRGAGRQHGLHQGQTARDEAEQRKPGEELQQGTLITPSQTDTHHDNISRFEMWYPLLVIYLRKKCFPEIQFIQNTLSYIIQLQHFLSAGSSVAGQWTGRRVGILLIVSTLYLSLFSWKFLF